MNRALETPNPKFRSNNSHMVIGAGGGYMLGVSEITISSFNLI